MLVLEKIMFLRRSRRMTMANTLQNAENSRSALAAMASSILFIRWLPGDVKVLVFANLSHSRARVAKRQEFSVTRSAQDDAIWVKRKGEGRVITKDATRDCPKLVGKLVWALFHNSGIEYITAQQCNFMCHYSCSRFGSCNCI
jgi:redox-regulated HSP33 family molecular chaperone